MVHDAWLHGGGGRVRGKANSVKGRFGKCFAFNNGKQQQRQQPSFALPLHPRCYPFFFAFLLFCFACSAQKSRHGKRKGSSNSQFILCAFAWDYTPKEGNFRFFPPVFHMGGGGYYLFPFSFPMSFLAYGGGAVMSALFHWVSKGGLSRNEMGGI